MGSTPVTAAIVDLTQHQLDLAPTAGLAAAPMISPAVHGDGMEWVSSSSAVGVGTSSCAADLDALHSLAVPPTGSYAAAAAGSTGSVRRALPEPASAHAQLHEATDASYCGVEHDSSSFLSNSRKCAYQLWYSQVTLNV